MELHFKADAMTALPYLIICEFKVYERGLQWFSSHQHGLGINFNQKKIACNAFDLGFRWFLLELKSLFQCILIAVSE